MILAGALTSSPMWIPWALYWVGWAVFYVARFLLVTPTRNCEAIATGAAVVYWLAVYGFAHLTAWGWKATKSGYGIREAVDLGSTAGKLDHLTRRIVQGQTRARIWVATRGLLVGGSGVAALLALGVAGAWAVPLIAGRVVVGQVRARRRRAWGAMA